MTAALAKPVILPVSSGETPDSLDQLKIGGKEVKPLPGTPPADSIADLVVQRPSQKGDLFTEQQLIELRVAARIIKLLDPELYRVSRDYDNGFSEVVKAIGKIDKQNSSSIAGEFLEYFAEFYGALGECDKKLTALRGSIHAGAAAELHAFGRYEDSSAAQALIRKVDDLLLSETISSLRNQLVGIKNGLLNPAFKMQSPVKVEAA